MKNSSILFIEWTFFYFRYLMPDSEIFVAGSLASRVVGMVIYFSIPLYEIYISDRIDSVDARQSFPSSHFLQSINSNSDAFHEFRIHDTQKYDICCCVCSIHSCLAMLTTYLRCDERHLFEYPNFRKKNF